MSSRNVDSIILAGGCFWGVEHLIAELPGVIQTTVGYSGGFTENPNYETVRTGQTGHAEAVKVVFDSQQINLETLLKHFFRLHDPTTKNSQGNDRGTQYRSAIFVNSPSQENIAKKTIDDITQAQLWPAPIVTEILPLIHFYPAEEYHQQYLSKHPQGYNCHFWR